MRRQKVYYWHELPGHNFRLTNFQAAMGCAQIRHYDEVCSRRRALQANYVKALATLEGATLQRFEPAVHAVPWSMPVKLAAAVYPQGRDSVLLQMHKSGVECRPGFYTPEQMAMPGAPFLPVADDLARTIINLPMFHDMTDEQLDFVVQNLRSLCA